MTHPTPISVPPASLLEHLKAGTRELHARAERSGVMGELLARRARRAAYVALLHNLVVLYDALEQAQHRLRGELHARGLVLPVLARSQALRADLAVWAGQPHTAPSIDCVEPVARSYGARLGQADVPALLAHVYLRVLGDLHGGQILATLVQQQFGRPEPGAGLNTHGARADASSTNAASTAALNTDATGTAFYRFGDAATVQHLRQALRAQLGAFDASAAQVERMVAEARWGFAAHIELFEGIQRRWGGAAPPTA